MTERRYCSHTRRDGQPCQMPPQADRDCCIIHDPLKQAERHEWRKQGGHKSRHRSVITRDDLAAPQSISEMKQLIARTAAAVAQGQCDLKIGQSVASLAQQFIRAEEIEKLQTEVEAMKAKLNAAT